MTASLSDRNSLPTVVVRWGQVVFLFLPRPGMKFVFSTPQSSRAGNCFVIPEANGCFQFWNALGLLQLPGKFFYSQQGWRLKTPRFDFSTWKIQDGATIYSPFKPPAGFHIKRHRILVWEKRIHQRNQIKTTAAVKTIASKSGERVANIRTTLYHGGTIRRPSDLKHQLHEDWNLPRIIVYSRQATNTDSALHPEGLKLIPELPKSPETCR